MKSGIEECEVWSYYNSKERKIMKDNFRGHTHGGNAVYGLGFIGALVFYISQATTFGMGVVGVLKAIVWPAFFVYEALKFLAR